MLPYFLSRLHEVIYWLLLLTVQMPGMVAAVGAASSDEAEGRGDVEVTCAQWVSTEHGPAAWSSITQILCFCMFSCAASVLIPCATCSIIWRFCSRDVLPAAVASVSNATGQCLVHCSCFHAWRVVAVYRHATANKVQAFRATSLHQLAVGILQEWAELAWKLPRERKAVGLQDKWLKQRSIWAWCEWMQLKARWQQLESDVATHWCNLHLAAAWRAWLDWVQRRQQKKKQADAVCCRWRNLHLAAAFQAWFEWVQVTRHHNFVHQTIAGRWRNLHTAAAFGAWKSFVAQQKASRAVSEAVAQRWNNLHLAAAFGAWKDATQAAAARAAAAEAEAQQKVADNLAVMFFKWKDYAAQQAELQFKASRIVHKRHRAELGAMFQGWKAVVQWQKTKQLADSHWRLVVLQSLLRLWRGYAATKERHRLVSAAVSRCLCSYQQLLQPCRLQGFVRSKELDLLFSFFLQGEGARTPLSNMLSSLYQKFCR